MERLIREIYNADTLVWFLVYRNTYIYTHTYTHLVWYVQIDKLSADSILQEI